MKARINSDYAYYDLEVVRSRIQGVGVIAKERIPAKQAVIEHTGRLMNRRQYREFRIAVEPLRQHHYVWMVDGYWCMDGAVGGSGAEFVNHSCDPNLFVGFHGKRIMYYALRAIKKGEELTIDYKFESSGTPIVCRCGSKGCRGTINLLPRRHR